MLEGCYHTVNLAPTLNDLVLGIEKVLLTQESITEITERLLTLSAGPIKLRTGLTPLRKGLPSITPHPYGLMVVNRLKFNEPINWPALCKR
jgi:hypothetical protein